MFLVGYSQTSKTEWRLCEGSEVLLRFESPPLEAGTLRQGEIVNLFRPVVVPGAGGLLPEKVFLCDPSFSDSKQASKVAGAFVQLNPRMNIRLSSPLQVVPKLLHKQEGVFLWRGDTWMAARYSKGEIIAQFELQPESWHSLPWEEPLDSHVRKDALAMADEIMAGIKALGPIKPGESLDMFGNLSPWQYRLFRDVLHEQNMSAGLVIRNFMPALLAYCVQEGDPENHIH